MDNLRNPVRFTQAVAAAAAQHGTFIEISPNPVLTYSIDDTLDDVHHHTLGTLARDSDDAFTFHTNLNAAHTVRPPVTPHLPEPHIALPTTPWQHGHHWIPAPPKRRSGGSATPRYGSVLGTHTPVAGATAGHLWQARLVPDARPYPGSLRIAGADLVPPSVLVATLAAAAAECGAAGVEDVRFDSPLTLEQPRMVQVFTDGEVVTIASAAADTDTQNWVRHVTARIGDLPPSGDAPAELSDVVPADPSAMDDIMSGLRISGHAFEWSVDSHEATPGRVRVEVALPVAPAIPVTAVLLDAALDTAQLVVAAEAGLVLPVTAQAITVIGSALLSAPARGLVDVRRYGGSEDDLVVDVTAQTPDGSVRVEVRGLRYRMVESRAALAPAADPATVAHAIVWQPWQRDGVGATPASIAVVGEGDSTQELRDGFGALGYRAADLSEARYVVYVPNVDTGEADVDVAVRLICEVGQIIAGLVDRDPRQPVTLWILTEGVYEAASATARRQSSLWALAGVIDAEQPQLWGGLLDAGAADEITDTARTLAAVLHTPSKSTVLVRDGQLLTSTLGPFDGNTVRQPLRCRSDAAYLITGGLGDLGLLMADWLGNRGARRVILLGRTKVPARSEAGNADAATRRRLAAIRGLERRGVTVETAAIDIGSAEAVQEFLAARDAQGAPPIRGVIHAAGLAEGQLLSELEPDRVRRTVWPKIAGAQVLDRAFPPGALDFLYLTASAGTVFGVPGQAAYAGGNAYLDGLARARHRQGDNTVSLDWVAWEGLGFGKDAAIVVNELERVGSRPINPVEASAAWEYVSRYDAAQVVMAPMQGAAQAAAGPASQPAVAWAEMSSEDMRVGLQDGVRDILAGELRLPVDQIELDKPFAEMGLNSVMAISIRRKLEQLVGIELSATMLFNHPTIDSFTGYLVARLSPEQPEETVDDDSAGSLLDALFDTVESTQS